MSEAKLTDKEYFATGVLDTNLDGLKKVYKGKVRDVYEVDEKHSLFVVTDRISSYDRVMKTPVPGKGKILNQISEFWFNYLESKTGIKNHMITTDIDKMPKAVQKHKKILKGRSMLVRKLKMIPVEAICRAYLTGSGYKDYKATGSLCGHKLKTGIQNCEKLDNIIFTPSTKAEYGIHDENITEKKAEEILKKIGYDYEKMKKAALSLFTEAIKYAEARGIILADTKFELGLLDGVLFIGDEILTPDSSRYWDKKIYKVGQQQDSLDKQFVRDYLTSINFDRNGGGVPLPRAVTEKTMEKYITIFKILTGKAPDL
mmetsp:Transcript_14393/g.21866  ORF Transcript_14393/g.21866 Transcript_14393/m.21866 type:complete len:315 (-) Transcript_14393:282-1226(-)|eukprot:CAMPEP_0167763582 /NCGR_PEP_ID=MMETSP0110_2-20121227/13470_1 /TAXON_ID=629695 /ORGANISM="Gymnochlora sp., Strain CCMP2014" /LENGTH=314 /DNA_ID=CAMNT_0007650717 /DNA_START=52 /DNA_END=996 /DNA_ORIENTATION=+